LRLESVFSIKLGVKVVYELLMVVAGHTGWMFLMITMTGIQ